MKEEERDDQGVQISPPGFNLIFLPFASDFRNLTIAKTTKGTLVVIPTTKSFACITNSCYKLFNKVKFVCLCA